jgi:coenzyme F420-reducing hydrogenase delta subunit
MIRQVFNNYESDLLKKYEKSSEKILIFNWERWLYFDSSWYDIEHRVHLCKLQLDNLLIEIEKYDICFFVISELIEMTEQQATGERKKLLQEFMTEVDKLNVFYIASSEDSNYPLDLSRTFNMPWFADRSIYTSQDTTIDFDYRQKDFTFNMLLGSEREYRTKMFEAVRPHSYVYSTYMGHSQYKNDSDTHLEDAGTLYHLTQQDLGASYSIGKLDTMIPVIQENRPYILSHVVPETIYNNTHFDIVCESQHVRGSMHFTTEKTAKPLSTGRFFIWFNSPNTAGYLRKYGFELQDYLSEYDNGLPDDARLETIFELIKEIGDNKNYIKKIYKDTKEARIHNQKVYEQIKSETKYERAVWICNQVEKI